MKRAITLVCGLFLASGFAVAGGGDKGMDKSFEDLDTNRDGAISKAEAAASQTLIARFDKADTNMDGKIENREFRRLEEETEEAE